MWGATGFMVHALLASLRKEAPWAVTLTAEDQELRALLGDVHTIAVVGLSSRPGRPSLEVARYLQDTDTASCR